MDKKDRGFFQELEENLMLIPLAIAVFLHLLTFVGQKFISPELTASLLGISYYAYAWIASLGIAVCAREKAHMRISVFDKIYPAPVKAAFSILSEAVGCIVMLVLLYFSFSMLANAISAGEMNAKIPTLIVWPAYAAPVAGMLFALIRTIVRLVKGGKKA